MDDGTVLPVLDTRADVHLTLLLTHDCNLRCRYCYTGQKQPRHMSMAVARSALQLAVARTGERLHLVFFGGEPLLRWESLQEITVAARTLTTAAGLELRPTVTTNGTLLDGERAAWLAAQRFLVAVSCDGTREAHDRNRAAGASASSHGAAVESVRRLVAAGIEPRVVMVLDPSTVAAWPDSVASIAGLGVRHLVVNVNWAADWSSPETQRACERAFSRVGELYVQAHRAGHPLWVSSIDDKIATHVRGGYQPSERCDLGRFNLVVAASGRLYPCDRLVGEDPADSPLVLGDVWNGPDRQRVMALLGRVRTAPECGECALAPRCRYNCACANLAMTGSLDAPSETLCFHEQLSIRTADDVAHVLYTERNASFLRRHYPGATMLE